MDPFPDTRNSLIGQAVEGDMEALSALATNYSPAIRALVHRKWGERPDKGRDDLVQEILKEICVPGRLAHWKADKGRFRQWICGIANNIISGAYRRDGAQKRWGGLERMGAEALDSVASSRPTPREEFDMVWAETVLELAKSAVRERWAASGKAAIFDQRLPFAMCDAEETYAELAAELGLPESTLYRQIVKLHEELREACLGEVQQTCLNRSEAVDELRYLMGCLASAGSL